MSQALIVFLKQPEAGKVKTRLAKDLGAEKALEIYKTLLVHVRAVALSVDSHRYAYFQDHPLELEGWTLPDFTPKLQTGSSLGDRMFKAFSEVLSTNHEKAVLIGSDLPLITSAIIEKAFLLLDYNDAVIGPAVDGGYYLIGMKKSHDLFSNLTWSTSHVFQDTIERIESQRLTYALLPVLPDIDTAEDWKKYGPVL